MLELLQREILIIEDKIRDFIIGDMDSIDSKLRDKFSDKIIKLDDQNANDLSKTLGWLDTKGIKSATIIGADGLRDDHSIGNILLLLDSKHNYQINMITNFGTFTLIKGAKELKSFKGEKISLFSINSKIKISSDQAIYNRLSNDTKFMGNVLMVESDNIITSNNLDLYASKNLITIFDNIKLLVDPVVI